MVVIEAHWRTKYWTAACSESFTDDNTIDIGTGDASL